MRLSNVLHFLSRAQVRIARANLEAAVGSGKLSGVMAAAPALLSGVNTLSNPLDYSMAQRRLR